ncbi:hypothetical protein IGI37_003191 [Enterococcus sp. AZ194]
MTQIENTIFLRKGKHLDYEERNKIEACKQLDEPLSNRAIAKLLVRAPQMIHSEVKDGTVRQIRCQVQNSKTYEYESFVYSTDVGQAAYENARTNSRKQPKWVALPNFMAYADHQMKKEKQSPDVVVGRAKKLA